jgi:hypothetical protein
MLASASGELKTRSDPYSLCLVQNFFAAGVSHVLPIDHDPWIAAHFVKEAGIDEVGHGMWRNALASGGFTGI